MDGKRSEKHQTTTGVIVKDDPMETDGGENGAHMELITRHTSPKVVEDETQGLFNRFRSLQANPYNNTFYAFDTKTLGSSNRDATLAHGVTSTI
jgi:hypothetical protein